MNNKNIFSHDRIEGINLQLYIQRIYRYVALALLITGLTVFFSASSEKFLSIMYVMGGIDDDQAIRISNLGWIIIIMPIIISTIIGFAIYIINSIVAHILLWSYAILLGLSLNSLLLIFTIESVVTLFFTAASMFSLMSIYGYFTRDNLASLGSYLIMELVGILVVYVISLFWLNENLDPAIPVIGTLIFTCLTASDMKRIKKIYSSCEVHNQERAKQISIIGALALYLDFVNIFMHLTHLFDDRQQR